VPALRADGTEFPVELAITRLTGDGPPVFTGYIRDITERQRAEAERAELLAREQAARTEVERALRARDDFLSIAAHELKSPVAVLRGHTQLLQRRAAREPALDTRYLRSLQVMDEQAERLAHDGSDAGYFTDRVGPLHA
jgi:signal transduction histidine kinase